MGADELYLENCKVDSNQPWKCPMKVIEIIVHKLYNKKVKKGKVQFQRKDHDIALLRIDYPINDYQTGLDLSFSLGETQKKVSFILGANLLAKSKFNHDELMPICLPPSDKFEDTGKGKVHL